MKPSSEVELAVAPPIRAAGRDAARWPARASLALIVLMLVTAVGAGISCGGGGPDLISTRGRVLEMHVPLPTIVDKVAFQDSTGRHRVLRPKASNRQLAAILVTIVNRTSTVVPMLVDGEAIKIGDRRGQRIGAVDIISAASDVDEADPEEGTYVPFLWGEIELERNRQISGWVVFDVPKGLRLGSLWWDEVESIIADYADYRRN